MTIIAWLKLWAVVIILGICSFYVWNYHRLQTKVAEQKLEIDNLKTVQEVLLRAKQATEDYIANQEKTRKRVIYEQKQIDKEVATVDDTGLDGLYDRYRVRPKGKAGNPSNGGAGRPVHPPTR